MKCTRGPSSWFRRWQVSQSFRGSRQPGLRMALALGLWSVLSGCVSYAQVYVDAVDAETDAKIGANIYSGSDGRYLGPRPVTFFIKRVGGGQPVEYSFIVDAFRGCHALGIYRGSVTRWARTKQEAATPEFTNEFRIEVPKRDSCTAESADTQQEG